MNLGKKGQYDSSPLSTDGVTLREHMSARRMKVVPIASRGESDSEVNLVQKKLTLVESEAVDLCISSVKYIPGLTYTVIESKFGSN